MNRKGGTRPTTRAKAKPKIAIVPPAGRATYRHPSTRREVARELVKAEGFTAGVAFAEALLAKKGL